MVKILSNHYIIILSAVTAPWKVSHSCELMVAGITNHHRLHGRFCSTKSTTDTWRSSTWNPRVFISRHDAAAFLPFDAPNATIEPAVVIAPLRNPHSKNHTLQYAASTSLFQTLALGTSPNPNVSWPCTKGSFWWRSWKFVIRVRLFYIV